MVHIKFSAHHRTPVVSSDFESMASDEAPEISTQQREASIEQLEESLMDQQRKASTEVASSHGAEFDRVLVLIKCRFHTPTYQVNV
jgi:hypothetical protein